MPFISPTPTVYVLAVHQNQFKAVMKSLGWDRVPTQNHFVFVRSHKDLVGANREKGKSFVFPLSGWQKGVDSDRIQQVLAVKQIPEVSTSFISDMIESGYLNGVDQCYEGLDLADLNAMPWGPEVTPEMDDESLAEMEIAEAMMDLEKSDWGDY